MYHVKIIMIVIIQIAIHFIVNDSYAIEFTAGNDSMLVLVIKAIVLLDNYP